MDIASVSQDEKSSGNGQWYIRVNVLNTTNIFKPNDIIGTTSDIQAA